MHNLLLHIYEKAGLVVQITKRTIDLNPSLSPANSVYKNKCKREVSFCNFHLDFPFPLSLLFFLLLFIWCCEKNNPLFINIMFLELSSVCKGTKVVGFILPRSVHFT